MAITFIFNIIVAIKITVSGQLPPRKIAPRLGLGFGLGFALKLRLETIFLGATALEPKVTYRYGFVIISFSCSKRFLISLITMSLIVLIILSSHCFLIFGFLDFFRPPYTFFGTCWFTYISWLCLELKITYRYWFVIISFSCSKRFLISLITMSLIVLIILSSHCFLIFGFLGFFRPPYTFFGTCWFTYISWLCFF